MFIEQPVVYEPAPVEGHAAPQHSQSGSGDAYSIKEGELIDGQGSVQMKDGSALDFQNVSHIDYGIPAQQFVDQTNWSNQMQAQQMDGQQQVQASPSHSSVRSGKSKGKSSAAQLEMSMPSGMAHQVAGMSYPMAQPAYGNGMQMPMQGYQMQMPTQGYQMQMPMQGYQMQYPMVQHLQQAPMMQPAQPMMQGNYSYPGMDAAGQMQESPISS